MTFPAFAACLIGLACALPSAASTVLCSSGAQRLERVDVLAYDPAMALDAQQAFPPSLVPDRQWRQSGRLHSQWRIRRDDRHRHQAWCFYEGREQPEVHELNAFRRCTWRADMHAGGARSELRCAR